VVAGLVAWTSSLNLALSSGVSNNEGISSLAGNNGHADTNLSLYHTLLSEDKGGGESENGDELHSDSLLPAQEAQLKGFLRARSSLILIRAMCQGNVIPELVWRSQSEFE